MTAAAHPPHIWTRLRQECPVASDGCHPESRIALVDADILDMAPEQSRHATAVQWVDDALRAVFGAGS